MRNPWLAAVLGTLILAGGCTYAPAPVPVAGARADIAKLAGEWRGEYWSSEQAGRSGSILFRLAADQDTAHGDVLMLVHAPGRPPDWVAGQGDIWTHAMSQRQLLSITFVRAAGDRVAGRLDPYADPGCGCTLDTRFTGSLAGDVIEGMYTSVHVEGGSVTGGRWRVTRFR